MEGEGPHEPEAIDDISIILSRRVNPHGPRLVGTLALQLPVHGVMVESKFVFRTHVRYNMSRQARWICVKAGEL
jgi:hypothetical protein